MWRRKRRSGGKIIFASVILLLMGFVYGYVTSDETNVPKKLNHIVDENIGLNIGLKDKNKKPQKQKIDTPTKKNEELGKRNNINIDQNNQYSQNIEGNENSEEGIHENRPLDLDNDIVTENTDIQLSTYYSKTRNTVTRKSKLPNEVVGCNFDELREYLEGNYNEWTIKECSKNKVELHRTTDEIPPNYYIVKEYDGYIGVFKVNEQGENELLEKTEIPVNSLSHVDLEYIKNGIIKKEREEINQLLEAYSS